MASEYRIASDGLLARESGDWAREKLYYAERYMSIFNGAMHRKWPSRLYVDLLAGCGRNILKNSVDEFDGSPLIAAKLDNPFSDLLFVEHDAGLADALRKRLASGDYAGDVYEADANSADLIDRVRRRCGPGLALVFVDFLGLEVTFETLRRITAGRRMDLLLTFQVNDLTRNVPQVLSGEHPAARLDAFFGTPNWRAIAVAYEMAMIASSDLGTALTNYYCERLATLGYDYVAPLQRLMRNTTNAPLYRLVLASKNPKGKEFFEKISRIEYSGQRSMF